MRTRLPVRLGIVAAAITAVAALGAAPALAFPTGPPVDCPGCPPNSLFVFNFYDGNQNLIGQRWFGCEGQPPGSWGDTSGPGQVHFVPC